MSTGGDDVKSWTIQEQNVPGELYSVFEPDYSTVLNRIAISLDIIAAEMTKRQHQEREAELERCLQVIATVRSRYAEDIFLPDSDSMDARSARLARLVCDVIRHEFLNP